MSAINKAPPSPAGPMSMRMICQPYPAAASAFCR
jgi:hypothetical protein